MRNQKKMCAAGIEHEHCASAGRAGLNSGHASLARDASFPRTLLMSNHHLRISRPCNGWSAIVLELRNSSHGRVSAWTFLRTGNL